LSLFFFFFYQQSPRFVINKGRGGNIDDISKRYENLSSFDDNNQSPDVSKVFFFFEEI